MLDQPQGHVKPFWLSCTILISFILSCLFVEQAELAACLEADGYKSVSEAVGADFR